MNGTALIKKKLIVPHFTILFKAKTAKVSTVQKRIAF
jgi:hypothetical protein